MILQSSLMLGVAGAAGGNGLNTNKKKAREFLIRVLLWLRVHQDSGECRVCTKYNTSQCGMGCKTCIPLLVFAAG